MKWLVELEDIEKYFPAEMFVKITEEIEAKRENHKKYVKGWRENHKVERENHKVERENHKVERENHKVERENHTEQNCKISPKTAIYGENSVKITRSGGEGGVLFSNTDPSNHVHGVTHSCTEKEKINKKEKFESEFENFWNAWPRHIRKEDKQGTCKRYSEALRTCKGLTAEKLLAALEWHKKSDQWQRDGGQYIPAPVVWFNKRKWEAWENCAQQPAPTEENHPPPMDPKEFVRLMKEGVERLRAQEQQQWA